jgi:hypothetical protein
MHDHQSCRAPFAQGTDDVTLTFLFESPDSCIPDEDSNFSSNFFTDLPKRIGGLNWLLAVLRVRLAAGGLSAQLLKELTLQPCAERRLLLHRCGVSGGGEVER